MITIPPAKAQEKKSIIIEQQVENARISPQQIYFTQDDLINISLKKPLPQDYTFKNSTIITENIFPPSTSNLMIRRGTNDIDDYPFDNGLKCNLF